IGEAPGQDVRIAQERSDSPLEGRDVPGLAESVAALEDGDRLLEIASAQVELPETAIRSDETVRVIHGLGDPYGLLCPSACLRELSTLYKHLNQPDPGENREQARFAEAFMDQVAFDGFDVALEAFPRTRVIAQTQINLP